MSERCRCFLRRRLFGAVFPLPLPTLLTIKRLSKDMLAFSTNINAHLARSGGEISAVHCKRRIRNMELELNCLDSFKSNAAAHRFSITVYHFFGGRRGPATLAKSKNGDG